MDFERIIVCRIPFGIARAGLIFFACLFFVGVYFSEDRKELWE